MLTFLLFQQLRVGPLKFSLMFWIPGSRRVGPIACLTEFWSRWLRYPLKNIYLFTLFLAALGFSFLGFSLVVARGLKLLQGIWDLRSPTMDRIGIPGIESWILNHWITRKVLAQGLLFIGQRSSQ